MDTRRRVFAGFLLVLAGAALYLFGVRPLLGPSAAQWDAQVRQDSVELVQVLRPDPWVEDEAAFLPAWDKRRALYDAEHLAELRARLGVYVEWRLAEQAGAAEVWATGVDPRRLSDSVARARDGLRAAYSGAAEPMVRWADDELREPAYRSSPVVAGADPELPDYRELHDRLRSDWLPRARARVESLTAPPR